MGAVVLSGTVHPGGNIWGPATASAMAFLWTDAIYMLRKFKDKFSGCLGWLRGLSWWKKILLVFAAMGIFSFAAIEITGQPEFCNSCHIMDPYYASWEESNHSEVNCLKCHLQPGFAGYVAGKINGLAQAVDCLVGRVGTKPNGTVVDESCLRSDCHDVDELAETKIDYRGIKFTHAKHVQRQIDGIPLKCGTCHSHFEGDEHFSVNNDVCFTCHFLKKDNGKRLVETTCTSCHEVPDKVIQRGLVKINHAEFVSYNASCEDSCHSREIRKSSAVEETICLNCHSFRLDDAIDSEELHEQHAHGHKVECFACHGEVVHGQVQVESVASMMDCQNCHSETHQIQRSMYSTEYPTQHDKNERVLSPMFLTHVECTSCHVDKQSKNGGGTLDSFGKVAKATPAACDRCHEPGTGERYVPFWQKQIKSLYESVRDELAVLEEQLRKEMDSETKASLGKRVAAARSILESIASDGSWGVHNFKYAESILLEARAIVRGDN